MTDQHGPEQPSAQPVIGGTEIKKIGYSLYLKMPENRLECRCSYVPHEQGSMRLIPRVRPIPLILPARQRVRAMRSP